MRASENPFERVDDVLTERTFKYMSESSAKHSCATISAIIVSDTSRHSLLVVLERTPG